MQASVGHALFNSLLQTSNALVTASLNFLLMLVYARVLGPERLGSLVTSQAQVLIWVMFIDLGLSTGLIGALTRVEADKAGDSRQSFRALDLILQVLWIRLIGAILGSVIVTTLAYRHAKQNGEFHWDMFWQNIAFLPHLFALALHQTTSAYALFRGRQLLAISANLAGIVVTVFCTMYLALTGHNNALLLVSQSWGGFLTAMIIVSTFWQRPHHNSDDNIRLTKNKGPWKQNALAALLVDVWPYTLVLATIIIWQRLDQISASHFLGFEAGGQYALAIRIVAIPILMSNAVSIALFPDLQRIGRDAPHKMAVYVGAIGKFCVRYGMILVVLSLALLAAIVVPILPKFGAALKLLPWFVPGVWCYWVYNFMVSSLFGVRKYKQIAKIHLAALLFYVISLPLLTPHLGLVGVILSYDVFCISLFSLTFMALKRNGILTKNFKLTSGFSPEELLLWQAVRGKVSSFLRR